MNWRKATKLLIVLAVVLIIAYDVFAYASGGVEATISRVVLGWSRSNPIIPFGVGVIAGHLFWAQDTSKDKPSS